jgi:REP element-mobilizing transposase RayT
MEKIIYKNRLPHYAPIGGCFFVTFRLADSLPTEVFMKLSTDRKQELAKARLSKSESTFDLEERINRKYFGLYDNELDLKGIGSCVLRQEGIRNIVANKLHKYHNSWYKLQAYCIMPNHVHVLFDTGLQIESVSGKSPWEKGRYAQLDWIMQHLKGGSSRVANQELCRKGAFWQKDSYDHFVRSYDEWQRIVTYILNNPVKAGLVDDWTAWKGSYLFSEYS